jgi:hypothetical protein
MFVGSATDVADDCERAVPTVPLLRVRWAAGAVARMQVRRPLVVVIDGSHRRADAERVLAGARAVGAEVVQALRAGPELVLALQDALLAAEQRRARRSPYWSEHPGAVIEKLTLPEGPFTLSFESIDEHVVPGRFGVYVLLHLDEAHGDLVVARVGRSDSDLHRRLQAYLRDPAYQQDERYDLVTHFSCGCPETLVSSFETECVLYHDWEPPLNDRHPGRPAESDATCPVDEKDPTPPLDEER